MVPLLGALPSRGSGVGGRRGTAPRGFPGTRPPVRWRGRPLPAGEGRDPVGGGRGSPAAGAGPRGRLRLCAARRGAALLPGGRCILRVSTRGCGRKEGIRPLHTSPLVRHAHSLAPARSLPRSPSLTHTRAHTPPRLPLSRPLPLRLLRAAAGLRTRPPARAGAPAARSVPRRQDWGEPRAAPRGKSARCRGRGGRIASEGRLPSKEGAPWPAGAARQAARGASLPPQGEPGCLRPAPARPLLSAGRAGREFPTSKLSPARSRAASLPGARGPHPPPLPRPPCDPEPPRPPRAEGWQRRGPSPRAERGWGGGAQSQQWGRDPGVPGAPPPPATGARLPGPSQRRGPGPGNTERRERVRAGVCARSWRVRGHLEADSKPRRHARLRPPRGEGESWSAGTPAGPTSATLLPSGRRAGSRTGGERGAALPSSLGLSYGSTVPST